jgi:two-component system sensor histidine kinase ResE
MTEKQLEAVFQPFTRGQDDHIMITPGLGLGLYICRMIVELHGGSIKVTSKINAGSTFIIELPQEIV